jgi:hypothetical protein
MIRGLDSCVGYVGWQCRSVARLVRPNPALNTDAHRRAFSPPAVSGQLVSLDDVVHGAEQT